MQVQKETGALLPVGIWERAVNLDISESVMFYILRACVNRTSQGVAQFLYDVLNVCFFNFPSLFFFFFFLDMICYKTLALLYGAGIVLLSGKFSLQRTKILLSALLIERTADTLKMPPSTALIGGLLRARKFAPLSMGWENTQ